MKEGIIIQARSGSTRLPRKILLPFYREEPLITILINRIKQMCPSKTVVLATTDHSLDDELVQVARATDVPCFRGDEENVLNRFICAAETFGMERFIRVCSDNPFLRPESFEPLFQAHDANPVDYLAYGFANGLPTIKSHLGLFAELTTTEALRQVATVTKEKPYLEHVTLYLYTHPESFSVRLLSLPDGLEGQGNLRFTLDTMEDFTLLQTLYATYVEETDQTIPELLELLKAHPVYQRKMLENIALNEK